MNLKFESVLELIKLTTQSSSAGQVLPAIKTFDCSTKCAKAGKSLLERAICKTLSNLVSPAIIDFTPILVNKVLEFSFCTKIMEKYESISRNRVP